MFALLLTTACKDRLQRQQLYYTVIKINLCAG
nr:MAG TPA: hypothetical protein [Caudoviricetes sp.]